MCVAENLNSGQKSRVTKVYKGLADQLLLRTCSFLLSIQGCLQHTHVCRRTGEFRVAPKGQRLQRFARPVVAVSAHTHMCVAAPNIQGLQRFRRPSAAASTHMCVAEIRVAPRGQSFIKALPTNCCCEHTHVCFKTNQVRAQPMVEMLQGFSRKNT